MPRKRRPANATGLPARPGLVRLEDRVTPALHIENFSDDFDPTRPGYDSWDADPNTAIPDEMEIPSYVTSSRVFLETGNRGNSSHVLTVPGGPNNDYYLIDFLSTKGQPGGLDPDGEVVAVGVRFNGSGRIQFYGDNGIKTLNVNQASSWGNFTAIGNDPSDSGGELGAIRRVLFTPVEYLAVDDVAVLVLDSGFSNNPPEAKDDSAVVRAGTSRDIAVLANDLDPDNDPLTISAQPPLNGTTEVRRGPAPDLIPYVVYTPNLGYLGLDSFTYTVHDGRGAAATATVSVSVEAPVAADDDVNTLPDQSVEIDVLANDTNPGGSFSRTVTIDSGPAGGSAEVQGGLVTYAPAAGFHGRDKFTYTIHDPFGNSSTAEVWVTVNSPPTAGDIVFTIPHGFTGRFAVPAPGLLARVSDPDNDELSVDRVQSPDGGTVTFDHDGSFTFDPSTPDGVVLNTTFSYTFTDEFGGRGRAEARLVVENTPPVAYDQTVSFDHGRRGPVTVRVYYDDADGDAATLAGFNRPTRGTVTPHGGGVDTATGRRFLDFEYDTPSHVFLGPDTFSYSVRDRYFSGNTATVTIDVPNYRPEVVIPVGKLTRSYVGGFSLLTPGGSTTVTDALFVRVDDTPQAALEAHYYLSGGGLELVPPHLAIDSDGDSLHPVLVDRPLHGVVRFYPMDRAEEASFEVYLFEYIPHPPLLEVTQAGLGAVVQDVFARFPNRYAAIAAADTRLAVLVGAELASMDAFLDAATALLRDVSADPAWEPFVLTEEEIQYFRARLPDAAVPQVIFGTDTFSYRLSDGVEESEDAITVFIQQSLGNGLARSDLLWQAAGDERQVTVQLIAGDLLDNDSFDTGWPATIHAQDLYVHRTFTQDDDGYWVQSPGRVVELDEWLTWLGPEFSIPRPGEPVYTRYSYQFLYPPPGLPDSDSAMSNTAEVVVVIFDSPQGDPDGVDDGVEQQYENGGGDGNGDGVPDRVQAHVATLPNADGNWVTLATGATTPLWGVKVTGLPSPETAPPDVEFPLGFFEFNLAGLAPGEATTVTLYPHTDFLANTYYKYGVEPFDNPSTPDIDERRTNHWYEFLYDGTTGAEIFYGTDPNGVNIRVSHIVLHLMDGARGDNDLFLQNGLLLKNGIIRDPGGPAYRRPRPLDPPQLPPAPPEPPLLPPTLPAPPRPVGVAEYAVGSDVGTSGVARLFNPDGSERFAVTPFGPGYTAGVRTAAADFNADGVADLAVGTGPGLPTRVIVLDGKTQAELFALDPFESTFTGGVCLAAGDLDGDGFADLVITPDDGGGPRVRVFSGNGFAQLADFLGLDDPAFRGGARAAVADINGDGVCDLLIAAGLGGGPRVAVFDGKSVSGGAPARLVADFFAFEPGLRAGVSVASGDLDGDGFADLIAGGGPGGGPRVLVLSGKGLLAGVQTQLANFFAGDATDRGGVRLAVKDLDGDDQADLIAGAGAAGSRVTAYAGKAVPADGLPVELFAFDAFPEFAGGVFVG